MRLWGWGQVPSRDSPKRLTQGQVVQILRIFRIPRAKRCTDGGRHGKQLSRLGDLASTDF